MQIGNFIGLFEVSVGLHLAYGLLHDLAESPIVRVTRIVDKTIQNVESYKIPEKDKSNFWTFVNIYRRAETEHAEPIRDLIGKLMILCLIVAAYAIACVVFITFKPSYDVSWQLMIVASAFALLPMPLFLIVTMFMSNKALKELWGHIFKVLQSANKVYDIAYRQAIRKLNNLPKLKKKR